MSQYDPDTVVMVHFTLEEATMMQIKNKVSLTETLKVKLIDGLWVVTNPDGHPSWIGKHTYKNGAVLEYLKHRLGIQE